MRVLSQTIPDLSLDLDAHHEFLRLRRAELLCQGRTPPPDLEAKRASQDRGRVRSGEGRDPGRVSKAAVVRGFRDTERRHQTHIHTSPLRRTTHEVYVRLERVVVVVSGRDHVADPSPRLVHQDLSSMQGVCMLVMKGDDEGDDMMKGHECRSCTQRGV
jgi:hypothetical protein